MKTTSIHVILSRTTIKLLFLFLVIFCSFHAFYYIFSILRETRSDVHQQTQKHHVTILIYPYKQDPSAIEPDLYFSGNARSQCALDFDCFVQSQSHNDVRLFDALIVGIRFGVKRFLNDLKSQSPAFQRLKNQIWVYWSLESVSNERNFEHFDDPLIQTEFNWTVMQSEKSTFNCSMMDIKRLESPQSLEKIKLELDLYSRSKKVCWIVSNCATLYTDRTSLVAKDIMSSMKSSKLHVWGERNRKCLPSDPNLYVNHGKIAGHYSEEYFVQHEMRDCLFYLAFENSNCSHYITEKFLNSLQSGSLPIVNGWLQSYQELLPNSYIHVSEFENIPKMVSLIEQVSLNESAMLEYHAWRMNWRAERPGIGTLCQICRKVYEYKQVQTFKPDVIPDIIVEVKKLQVCNSG